MSTIDKLIKRQIKLTILSVIAVVLITSTITYALYQTNHENTIDQVISIGNLGLTATGTPITLEGLYPMEEYDLTSSYPSYNFTLENKTNGVNNDYTLMYELILRADANSTLTQDDYQYIMYKIDGSEAKPLSEVWDSEINGFKILDGRLLSHEETTLSTKLANKDIENHSLVFWLSTYAPNSIQGKVLTLKMSLEAYADRFNYLKYYEYAEDNIFGKTLNRSDFESITTLDKIEIPASAIESWDVSSKQNKSIMAWYTDNDNNGLYELYLGQIGGVIANPNCNSMFRNDSNVKTIDLSLMDTMLATNMGSMFSYCSNLVKIEFMKNAKTSNVTSFDSLFYGAGKLESANIWNWDTSNIYSYNFTFCLCGLKSYDFKKWDTSNAINMHMMFYNIGVSELDLSSFNTSKVTDFGSMFRYCGNLKKLNISNMTFENDDNHDNIFGGMGSLTEIITNECAEKFIRDRLVDANRSNVTLEIVPCVKVCYSDNLNKLPSEYTELDYIESTGTQYIDSGYKPTPSTGVYADFQYSDTTVQQRIFGVVSTITVNNTLSYNFYINGSGKFAYSYQNNIGNWISTNITVNINRHTLSFNVNNDRKIYIDNGKTYSSNIIGSPTITSPYNMYILYENYINNQNTTKTKARLYSFEIYENGVFVRNYTPALRKSDNAVGLYETEEGKFYENSGTGVFNSDRMQTLTGNTIKLAHTIDARPGYTFVGWNTKPDGTGTTFKQGEEVDIDVLKSLGEGTITLYAMWEAN